jgi:ABC-type nitrate/sulfonate/bicarbonate transport system substrate-binding protein
MMKEKAKRSKIGKSLSLVAAALLVTVVSLTACAPPQPAQQFTLRIGVMSTLSTLPYFVMREQGFDKENGLQFVEIEYGSGSALVEAMAAGSIDTATSIGSVSILDAAERNLIPDKIVPIAAHTFVDPEHPQIGVVAGSSITNWQDLKGQQVAINAKTSLNEAAIIGRLQQEGISDYKLVVIPLVNMGLAVAGGNVAAAVMSEPYLTQSLLRKDGKFLGWVIGGPPFENMELSMIAFSADMYRNNPEAVKAFLLAHLQSVKWISQNPDGARRILSQRLSIGTEVTQKINLLNWSLDGRNDPALLESMQPVMVEAGLLKAPIPVNQLYDETLLDEVLAENR